MAHPRPLKIPEWNTGGANRTEPLAGEKTAGWALNDQPPSSYFNWLSFYCGDWITWIDERLVTGSGEEDLTVNALPPTATGNGGELQLNAGDANTFGSGGSVKVEAGDGAGTGAGGDVTLTAGDGPNAGGGLSLTGGVATGTGIGGSVAVEAGDGSAAPGGALTLAAGDSPSDAGGSVSISAGQSGGLEGGEIDITGGASDTDGGEVRVTGGAVTGTDLSGGNLLLRSGTSTGTGSGEVFLQVSEAEAGGSGSGSYSNPVATYVRLNGASSQKLIEVRRYITLDNGADTGRGVMLFTPKAVTPTSPSQGDLYYNSTNERVAIYDGNGYRSLTPLIYDLNRADETGQIDPAAIQPVGQVAFQRLPSGGPISANPVRYQIPANSLRPGAVVRARGYFKKFLSVDAGFKVIFGSVGTASGSPPIFQSPSGNILAASSVASGTFEDCYIEAELSFSTVGATATGYYRGLVVTRQVTAFHDYLVQAGNYTNFDTTVANDVFPVVDNGTSHGTVIDCESFTVEVD